MALQPFTRSYSLPSGWQSGTKEEALTALGSAPQWAQGGGLKDVIERHFANKPQAAAKQTLSREARSAWEKAIAQYGPEGGYGKGVEAGLERGRTKAVAGGMQSLVSAGLAGTTMAGGLGKKYEEEVGAPTRARVEEVRAQAVANLQAGLAGAEQRGYETAEERALRERLSASQLGTQQAIAGQQTGLGYAQLESGERISAQDLALRELLAKANLQRQGQQPTTGDRGGPSPFGGGGAEWPMEGWR